MTDHGTGIFLGLTANIVASHLSHNQVSTEALPGLIQSVYRSLSTVKKPTLEASATPTPAVPVKKSVFPDFIVCLEDGKKLKMLKRHLRTSYWMTANDYRAKWGLPHDYPMVAQNYAVNRSSLAKKIGLGLGRKATKPPTEPEANSKVGVTQLPLAARRSKLREWAYGGTLSRDSGLLHG